MRRIISLALAVLFAFIVGCAGQSEGDTTHNGDVNYNGDTEQEVVDSFVLMVDTTACGNDFMYDRFDYGLFFQDGSNDRDIYDQVRFPGREFETKPIEPHLAGEWLLTVNFVEYVGDGEVYLLANDTGMQEEVDCIAVSVKRKSDGRFFDVLNDLFGFHLNDTNNGGEAAVKWRVEENGDLSFRKYYDDPAPKVRVGYATDFGGVKYKNFQYTLLDKNGKPVDWKLIDALNKSIVSTLDHASEDGMKPMHIGDGTYYLAVNGQFEDGSYLGSSVGIVEEAFEKSTNYLLLNNDDFELLNELFVYKLNEAGDGGGPTTKLIIRDSRVVDQMAPEEDLPPWRPVDYSASFGGNPFDTFMFGMKNADFSDLDFKNFGTTGLADVNSSDFRGTPSYGDQKFIEDGTYYVYWNGSIGTGYWLGGQNDFDSDTQDELQIQQRLGSMEFVLDNTKVGCVWKDMDALTGCNPGVGVKVVGGEVTEQFTPVY